MIAYIDESAQKTAGGLLYVVSSAVILKGDIATFHGNLREILAPGQTILHWKEIARPARPLVLQQVTDLPIVAFAVAAGAVHPRQQEAARVKVLQRLLHVLDRREGVHEVIIEARAPALNRRDAITIARARARGTVSTDLRYEHRRKSDPTRPHYLTLKKILIQVDWV